MIYAGSTCSIADSGCDDDEGSGLGSELQLDAQAGVPLHVVVGGFSAADSGGFSLAIRTGACLGGDACDRVTAVRVGTVTGTTVGQGQHYISACAFDVAEGSGREPAHSFTADSAGTWCADTRGSEFDTILSVRTTCERDSSETTCADDTGTERWSRVEVELDEDETVYLMIDGYDSYEAGEYQLTITPGGCD